LFGLSVQILGLTGLLILPRVQPNDLDASGRKLRYLAAILAGGVIVNYLLGLLCNSFDRAFIAALFLCVAGTLVYLKVNRGLLHALKFDFSWVTCCFLTAAGVLIGAQIVFEPLYGWDARSIWFFHAKVINHIGGLYINEAWWSVDFPFSHIDYPKMIAYLGAQFAHIAGFWNEYLPKWSLLLLLFPALLGIFSFCENRVSFIFLGLLFFVPGSLLWNGYMDGYLAIYAGLGALFALDWLESNNRVDLVAAVIFLTVACNLKNEGMVLIGVISVCLMPLIWRKFFKQSSRIDLWSVSQAVVCVLMIFGLAFLWVCLRQYNGIAGDMQFSGASLTKLSERFANVDPLLTTMRLMSLAGGLWQSVIVACVSAILYRFVHNRIPSAVLAIISMALIYTVILVVVYLSTPYDLVWHLLSSAPRTTLPITFLLGAASYRLLQQFERINK